MKSGLVEPKTEVKEKKPFPKPMIGKNTRTVVLFERRNDGMCLAIGSGIFNYVGEYRKDWTMENFVDMDFATIEFK